MATTYATPASDRTPFLRRALQIDAAVGVLSGAVFAAGSGVLNEILGIPSTVLLAAGLVLLPYAAMLWLAASRPNISRAATWAFIAADVLWIDASVALLIFGWLPLTTLGWWAVADVALIVAGLGLAKFIGLRRSR